MRIQKSSENCFAIVKAFEGISLKAYKCPAGIWTIGFGNTFYPDGTRVKEGEVITEARAIDLLKSTLDFFEKQVDNMTRDDISQNQFDALVDFAYNVGHGNLKSSTLLKLVNHNPKDAAIKDEFLKWNKVKGTALKGLTRRRSSEAHLYFNNALNFFEKL